MNPEQVLRKFGDYYTADESTFKMGIDRRITSNIKERFRGKTVLETCTGGGFTTIALAETAEKVISIEINKNNQDQAIHNVKKAGLRDSVLFVLGDCLNEKILSSLENIDAAFLDPDWADTGSDHIYKFRNSNTEPPADKLLDLILRITPNIALILPPFISLYEFSQLPSHEFQKIYLENDLALFCLYFGNLIKEQGATELHILN